MSCLISVLGLSLLAATTRVVSVFGASCNFAHGLGYSWAIGECFSFDFSTNTQFLLFECDSNTNSPVLHTWFNDDNSLTDCPDPSLVTPDDTNPNWEGECSSTEDDCQLIEWTITFYDTINDCTGDITGEYTYWVNNGADDVCWQDGTAYFLTHTSDTTLAYSIYSDDQCTVVNQENIVLVTDGQCDGSALFTLTVVDDGLDDGMSYLETFFFFQNNL